MQKKKHGKGSKNLKILYKVREKINNCVCNDVLEVDYIHGSMFDVCTVLQD